MAFIVKLGHVESTTSDPYGELRIKARLQEDGSGEVPWAFPLLPKQFQVVPKVGEGVFIISEDTNKKDGNRYYVGPIISQPQFNTKCKYSYGRGEAISGLQGHSLEPLPNINMDARTHGSFPNVEDVAVVGRDSQDIIMKHNKDDNSDEIDVRCGIRKEDTIAKNTKGITENIGKVIFNDQDPAYVQLKYKEGLGNKVDNYDANAKKKITEASKTNSVVNIAADKINLIGVGDDSLNVSRTDNETLIQNQNIDELMSELHQLPKGDVLVKCLKLMMEAILNHTHNYNGLKPTLCEETLALSKFDLSEILSKYVRIS